MNVRTSSLAALGLLACAALWIVGRSAERGMDPRAHAGFPVTSWEALETAGPASTTAASILSFDEPGARLEAGSARGPATQAHAGAAPDPSPIPFLPTEPALGGRVLDPQGEPVDGARVRFYWRAGDALEMRSTISSADGRFALGLAHAGLRGALHVRTYDDWLNSVVVEGVGGGDGDVQVRLRPPRELMLDPHGRERERIETFEARFKIRILGLWTGEGHRRRPRLDEALYWSVPDVPFQVTVSAFGYGSQTFGPFEPAAVGRVLRVDLEPLKVARGRVLWEGVPVAGAGVRFEHPPREPERSLDLERPIPSHGLQGGVSARVVTDAGGRFELPLEQSLQGTFDLVARKFPHGEARIRAVDVHPARDVAGLDLHLGPRGGAIRGVVVTPQEHAAGSLWIRFSRPGELLMTPVGDQGHFEVEGLAAGRWKLAVDGGGISGDGWKGLQCGDPLPDDPPSWYPYETPRFVDVLPGETVEVELDLTRLPDCRLEGVFLMDGTPLVPLRDAQDGFFPSAGRRAFLELDGETGFSSRAYVEADGRFRLAVERPGAYRLRLELPLEAGSQLVVLDLVEVRSGVVSWSLDLATGRVTALPGARAGPEPFHLIHRWRGPGELRVFSQFPVEDRERGQLVFPHPAAGTGALLLDPVRAPLAPLADVVVPPGGEIVVELP